MFVEGAICSVFSPLHWMNREKREICTLILLIQNQLQINIEGAVFELELASKLPIFWHSWCINKSLTSPPT